MEVDCRETSLAGQGAAWSGRRRSCEVISSPRDDLQRIDYLPHGPLHNDARSHPMKDSYR